MPYILFDACVESASGKPRALFNVQWLAWLVREAFFRAERPTPSDLTIIFSSEENERKKRTLKFARKTKSRNQSSRVHYFIVAKGP